MTIVELLLHLRTKGIHLEIRDGGLRYRAPAGALDAGLRAALMAHKAGLVALMGEDAPADAVRAAIDPRPESADSVLWQALLAAAFAHDGDEPDGVFGALHGIRCLGARLVRQHGRVRIEGGTIGDEYEAIRERYLVPHVVALRRHLDALAEAPSGTPP